MFDDPARDAWQKPHAVIEALTLKRGYTEKGKDIWLWRKTVVDGKTKRLSGTITLLNEARQEALVWHVYEAWPSKWSGPALNAKTSEIAIEELVLMHEGIVLE